MEFDKSLFYDPQLPLSEDISLTLSLPLKKTIQLSEPIKKVNKILFIPLNSHYYDEDKDLP